MKVGFSPSPGAAGVTERPSPTFTRNGVANRWKIESQRSELDAPMGLVDWLPQQRLPRSTDRVPTWWWLLRPIPRSPAPAVVATR